MPQAITQNGQSTPDFQIHSRYYYFLHIRLLITLELIYGAILTTTYSKEAEHVVCLTLDLVDYYKYQLK